MRILLGVLVFALFAFAGPTANAGLCDDPRIVDETAKFVPSPGVSPARCRDISADFRHNGQIHQIQLASVLRTAAWDGDVLNMRFDTFALLPDGALLALGEWYAVPAPSREAEFHVLDGLDINPALAGGTCCINFNFFYDYALEQRGDKLCMVYGMKPPFRGSFLDCDGYTDAIGEIGYGEDVISWDEAREISCQELTKADGVTCHPLATRLKRDLDGTLYWDTEVRSPYRVSGYRIDLVGGKVTPLH